MRALLDLLDGSGKIEKLSGSLRALHFGDFVFMIKAKYSILAAISVFVVAIDQFTKGIVLGRFRLGESLTVIGGFFNLTYIRNTGAAFGLLAESHPGFRVPFFMF